MDKQDLCEKCSHRNGCKDVYRKLGKVEAAPVAVKVVVAFLLPIVILICTLAFFQYILAGAVQSEGLRTAISLFLALLTTAGYILVIKLFSKVREKS